MNYSSVVAHFVAEARSLLENKANTIETKMKTWTVIYIKYISTHLYTLNLIPFDYFASCELFVLSVHKKLQRVCMVLECPHWSLENSSEFV